jgi:hypothetical protein
MKRMISIRVSKKELESIYASLSWYCQKEGIQIVKTIPSLIYLLREFTSYLEMRKHRIKMSHHQSISPVNLKHPAETQTSNSRLVRIDASQRR